MARDDGARLDVLKLITHTGRSTVMDLYSTLDWKTLCEAVSVIQIERRQPGEVVELKQQVCSGDVPETHEGRSEQGLTDGDLLPSLLPTASTGSNYAKSWRGGRDLKTSGYPPTSP